MKGLPLKKLDCNFNPISDATPLQKLPLAELNISGTKIADISILNGMPLAKLSLADVPNLSPLRGAPLRDLSLSSGTTDLSPLAGMSLEQVILASPRKVTKGIEILRAMNSLKTIGTAWDKKYPPAEFWKKYDAGEFNR